MITFDLKYPTHKKTWFKNASIDLTLPFQSKLLKETILRPKGFVNI